MKEWNKEMPILVRKLSVGLNPREVMRRKKDSLKFLRCPVVLRYVFSFSFFFSFDFTFSVRCSDEDEFDEAVLLHEHFSPFVSSLPQYMQTLAKIVSSPYIYRYHSNTGRMINQAESRYQLVK